MLRSDSALERDVAAELACDAVCRMAKIRIAVKNGIVTLSGCVADPALQMAAVRADKRVFGVDGIDSRFETSPRSDQLPTTAATGSVSSL
jgi:osmotically-inducible protein OsmY